MSEFEYDGTFSCEYAAYPERAGETYCGENATSLFSNPKADQSRTLYLCKQHNYLDPESPAYEGNKPQPTQPIDDIPEGERIDPKRPRESIASLHHKQLEDEIVRLNRIIDKLIEP